MHTLKVERRDNSKSTEKMLKEGKIPAVFYGPKEKSTPIAVSDIEFSKVWKEAGESSVIVLSDGTNEHEVLIQDVDVHPVTGTPRHADFYVMEKGKKVQVGIPLEFIGVAPAVKDLGGTLVKVLHELEIEALPKDLPHGLEVDISPLVDFDSQVLAKDIKLSQGITLITGPEEVVASVYETKEEIEEPVKTIEDIEVVGAKGKEEVEGEEALAAPEAEEKGGK